MIERRDIPEFPGYQAGCDGSIWSNRTRGGRVVPWRRMRPYRDGVGRLCVGPRRGGKLHRWSVHQLILLAFVGPRPKGMVGCHNNGDHDDNRPENLRWGTPRSNAADRDRHGRTLRGERNPSAKLRRADVEEIRNELARGTQQKVIARRFGVNPSCIQKIASGESWGARRPDPPAPGLTEASS